MKDFYLDYKHNRMIIRSRSNPNVIRLINSVEQDHIERVLRFLDCYDDYLTAYYPLLTY